MTTTTSTRPESTRLPPGPKPGPFGGHLFAFRRDPLGFLTSVTREYGDIVKLKIGPLNIFVLNHPDYIREVLVTNQKQFKKGRALERAKRVIGEGLLTSEGEFHLRQRRLAQPAFHRERVAAYVGTMAEYAARTGERWQDGTQVNMAEEMNRLTLAIVGKTLFSADVENEAAEVGEALTALMDYFNTFGMLPYAEFLEKLPLPQNRRFEKAIERLDQTIYRIVQEQRASGEDRGDLLSMLLLAQDTEGDGSRMTEKQVRDEALTLFLAGHETTANALTWAWYLLAQHPDVVTKLQAEVDTVLGDRLPGYEDVNRLTYTRMVLAEAMRLYPPAWIVGRRALADYQIGEYLIPARSIVIMSQYLMHRDPRYYPQPERFDPAHWMPEAQAQRPKFSYFPFGGGSRICIGEAFAWMEGIILLATLAQQWEAKLEPGHRLELKPVVTLRPKGGMPMVLKKR